MRARFALLVLATAELLVAALVVHAPDLGAAAGFLRGDYLTATGALAASSLLVWSALVIGVGALLISMVRRSHARVQPSRVLVGAVLAGSLVILGIGINHRLSEPSFSMCCGSISQAQQALDSTP